MTRHSCPSSLYCRFSRCQSTHCFHNVACAPGLFRIVIMLDPRNTMLLRISSTSITYSLLYASCLLDILPDTLLLLKLPTPCHLCCTVSVDYKSPSRRRPVPDTVGPVLIGMSTNTARTAYDVSCSSHPATKRKIPNE